MFKMEQLLLVVVFFSLLRDGVARDCNGVVVFRSNLSMESWCRTDIDNCSPGSLKSRFSSLFNSTGWAPGKPNLVNVTSYCQTDSQGHSQAGINITWTPPNHSGARDIKGFEMRIEGYDPEYKCAVIKLNENITQAVINSKLSATIYPVERNKNFIISLFSLPRSDDSTIVMYSLHSPKCERENISWSSHVTNFSILYDADTKKLNVSFTKLPDYFNISEFTLTIIGIKVEYFKSVRINKTFHVFDNVGVGKYHIRLSPYNPRPRDKGLCKCRDDRNQCVTCVDLAKNVGITREPTFKTSQAPPRTKTKWTTKIVIKNVTGKNKNKTKNKNKKLKKAAKKQARRTLLVALPVSLAIICVICIVVIFLLCRHRRSRGGTASIHKYPESSISKPGYLLCFEDKQNGDHQVVADCLNIFKGVLGTNVGVQNFGYRHVSELENQLLTCLNKIVRLDSRAAGVGQTSDHECSETCLVKEKSQPGKFGINIDCCLRNPEKEAVILVCVFGNRRTPRDIFDVCKRACNDTSNENIDCYTICVYPNKDDMPKSLENLQVFSYRDDLPMLLNYMKDVFLKQKDSDKQNKNGVTYVPSRLSTNKKDGDRYVQLSDTEDIWVELPDSLRLSNGPWMDYAKRQRYVSNDSGWGASENSTTIEEAKEASADSSLQFYLDSEQESQTSGKENRNSMVSQNQKNIYSQHPVLTRLQYTHSLMKCPSDISFFPPDEIQSTESLCNSQLQGYDENTSLTQIESVPCNNYNENTPDNVRMDKKATDKKAKRKSPSMETLMNMLRTINDTSAYYIEHEAELGEVHSVFEGTA